MTDNNSPTSDPLKKVWSILSIPLSVLGLLSLSEQLLTFHSSIKNIIDSYKSIVYPIYTFLLGWLWFEIPTWVYDYLTLGLLFATCHKRAFGFEYSESKLGVFLKNIISIVGSMVFWPLLLLGTLNMLRTYDKDGFPKIDPDDPNPLKYKYRFRYKEALVIRYIMATLIITVVVLIINYTYFLKT